MHQGVLKKGQICKTLFNSAQIIVKEVVVLFRLNAIKAAQTAVNIYVG